MLLHEMRSLVLASLACIGLGPAAALADLSPPMAAVSSVLVPGLGQALSKDYGAAAAHFGIFAASLATALHYEDKADFLKGDARYPDSERELVNQTTLRADFAWRVATDTALYSSFAAYRDARERDNSGYRTPAPKESLSDLALSPFRWQYLSRPTTFVPLAIAAAAAFGGKGGYGIYRHDDVSKRDLHVYNLTGNAFTAVGEEGFFRGFLNNELSSRWGNGWGLTVSSALFGIAHTGEGNTANALQAALGGAYLGWVHQRNGFEVGEGVAIHYWWNVIAGIAAIRNGGSAPLVSLRLPFN
jgi:membrane protease YdiL (CAAX protease family)